MLVTSGRSGSKQTFNVLYDSDDSDSDAATEATLSPRTSGFQMFRSRNKDSDEELHAEARRMTQWKKRKSSSAYITMPEREGLERANSRPTIESFESRKSSVRQFPL